MTYQQELVRLTELYKIKNEEGLTESQEQEYCEIIDLLSEVIPVTNN